MKKETTSYTSEVESSIFPITLTEKIKYRNFSNFEMLNEAVDKDGLTIQINNLVTVQVHNDKADNKDYHVYVVVTPEKIYYTSSESFARECADILQLIADSPDDKVEPIFNIIKKPSKNYSGSFITCNLV